MVTGCCCRGLREIGKNVEVGLIRPSTGSGRTGSTNSPRTERGWRVPPNSVRPELVEGRFAQHRADSWFDKLTTNGEEGAAGDRPPPPRLTFGGPSRFCAALAA